MKTFCSKPLIGSTRTTESSQQARVEICVSVFPPTFPSATLTHSDDNVLVVARV